MIPSFIVKVLDSLPFRVFFAIWTGVYLVQVLKGQDGAIADELWWIVIGLAVAIFFV